MQLKKKDWILEIFKNYWIQEGKSIGLQFIWFMIEYLMNMPINRLIKN